VRRIEEILPLTAVFALRERVASRFRHPAREAQFAAIATRRQRSRAFVLGTAPSLKRMDLASLDGEDYFVCNMAEHMPWMRERTHPYYIAADTGVPEKYEGGRPGLSARQFFYAQKLESRLDPDFIAENEVFFFAPAKGGVSKRGLTPEPWVSLAGGQTILLSAVQTAWALGYREIYVLGCDLDYSGPDPYAYRTTQVEIDRAKRNDDKMRAKTNEQFAILRTAIEARGGTLANAGIGGRLETLPRVDFSSIVRA
jgi:hypothetical protein